MSGCTTDRSFVSFRVFEDSDVLLSWYITEVQEDGTFLSALEKIRDASQEGGPRFLRPLSKDMTSPRCLVTSTAAAEPSGMDVNIQLPVGQVCKQFCLFVTYAFSKPPAEDQGDSGQQPRRNAFALLAEGAGRRCRQAASLKKKGIVGDAAVRGDWRQQELAFGKSKC